MARKVKYKSPYPYFGGKSKIAGAVWERFGDVRCYIEPFFGSGAVLLGRPQPFDGVETVNDMDGLISNFWRAIKHDPEGVAHYADWPVFENDLHARHVWLVERKDRLQAKLEGDPEFYDAKIAGWWVWGMSVWIGGEFCSGKGPWKRKKIDGAWHLINSSGPGQGVCRRLVHLTRAGQGVCRKRVHLARAGRGVCRKFVHLTDAGRGDPGTGECGLLPWMEALAERLRRVRVCSGDWRRVCGGNSGNALNHFFGAGQPCGIFLDPPYSAEAGRKPNIYRQENLTVAHEVREWALEHGDDPRLRIALCGYEVEHKMPKTWKCLEWKAQSGYSQLGKAKGLNGKANRHRERIWFSNFCLEAAA
jgi:site-specific DNA-adenine methylase